MLANQINQVAARSVPGVVAIAPVNDVVVLKIDERGMVRDCSGSCETLFKCCRSELVGMHVSLLLPQLAEIPLMHNGEPCPRLRFLSRLGRHFEAVTLDGEHFDSQLFLIHLDGAGQGGLSLIVRPADKDDLPAMLNERPRQV